MKTLCFNAIVQMLSLETLHANSIWPRPTIIPLPKTTTGVTDYRNDLSFASGYAARYRAADTKHLIGGIIRGVTLFAAPNNYITRLHVSTDLDSYHYPGWNSNFSSTTKPWIWDEWVHVLAYYEFDFDKDPNARNFWGKSQKFKEDIAINKWTFRGINLFMVRDLPDKKDGFIIYGGHYFNF